MSTLSEKVFRSLMGEDEWARHQGRMKNFAEEQAKVERMTDAQLAEFAQHIFKNCAPCQFQQGEPVYDGILHHNIIPELIKRLRD